MFFRNSMILILGLAGMVVPGWASLTFNIGDTANSTATTAINAWNTASGLSYLSQDTTFTGSLNGTPSTYTDPASQALFAGFSSFSGTNYLNGVSGSADNLGLSGAVLQQLSLGGIIEITFQTPVSAFAANFAVDLVNTSNSGYCVGVNQSGTSNNCQTTFSMTNGSDVVFVGISGAPISNVWIGPSASFFAGNGSSSGEELQINNFDIPGSATPEGSTLMLLGCGLILLGAIHRRRTRAAERFQ